MDTFTKLATPPKLSQYNQHKQLIFGHNSRIGQYLLNQKLQNNIIVNGMHLYIYLNDIYLLHKTNKI